MNKSTITEIFTRFSQQNPSPKSELNYHNDFEFLCAVVLSAQTTDNAVNKVTPKLFATAPTPADMAGIPVDTIENIISSIGLYKNKAKFLKNLSIELLERYQGKIPDTEEELLTLSGVGKKTARVVLNTLFGRKTIAVDTHIFRVAARIGLSCKKTPDAMSDDLAKKIPDAFLKNAHHHLILHGRYICTSRSPKCARCIIKDLCKSYCIQNVHQ